MREGWGRSFANLSGATAAKCRSRINEYELPVHQRKRDFKEISILVVQFSDSVCRIPKEIYPRQAVYFSYTSASNSILIRHL